MHMTPNIHPSASVAASIGLIEVCIGAFSEVQAGAQVGHDVRIGSHCVVESGARIGDGCRIGHGVHVGPDMVLEQGVEIGAGVGLAAGPGAEGRLGLWLREGACVGDHATLSAGLVLGAGCVVKPGAVVTRDVPPNAIVSGHPAHIVGYRDAPEMPLSQSVTVSLADEPPALHARGAHLVRLPKIVDLRGALSFGEIGTHLPFTPERFFVVYDVPSQEVRGEHAHRACHQFLVCVKGSCAIVVDDGHQRDEVVLDSARLGLHLAPMVWGIQYRFSPDAVLLVLASHRYDAGDYIRNYDEFLALVKAG